MSTLKVSSIQSPSTTDGGLAISSTGAVSGGLPVPNRNLLYNGAMQVAQRGTSATGITSGGYYTADRWYFSTGSFGTWTNTVESDGPAGSGLSKSYKLLCSTAQASPASSSTLVFQQKVEGQDLQRVAKGSSSAQQLTLSFWVKSNVTGTFIAEVDDRDNTRSVSASYAVTASGVWEYKTITFPADTTGAFDNDNNGSLFVSLWLGAGTDFTSGTLQTAWASRTNANRVVGQTNLASAVNNYWQVTGVQLETGPVATEFEHLPFGDELARCQRYYQVLGKITNTPLLMGAVHSTSVARGSITFPEMRTAPTTVTFPVMLGLNAINGSAGTASMSASAVTANSLYYTGTGMTGLTAGNATIFQTQDANGLRLSAEL